MRYYSYICTYITIVLQQQQQRHEHLVEYRCVNYMSGISSISTTLFWFFEAPNNSGDVSYKTGHIYRVVFFEGVVVIPPWFVDCIPLFGSASQFESVPGQWNFIPFAYVLALQLWPLISYSYNWLFLWDYTFYKWGFLSTCNWYFGP